MTTSLQLSFGRTPLATVRVQYEETILSLFLKLEQFNPCGSMKDRTAVALIESILPSLGPRTEVIESTSGNLGMPLAALCANLQRRFTAVVDPRTSESLIQRMEHLGATVVRVDVPDNAGGYLLTRLNYVQTRLKQEPDLVWTNQYGNVGNPQAHFLGTAPEVGKQLRGPAVILVPVSTGGTLAGFLRYARRYRLPWRVVGVDVPGSIAVGGSLGPRVLTGIGSSQPSHFVGSGDSEILRVSPMEAISACLWMKEETGVTIGGSSGATIAAAFRLTKLDDEVRPFVCICPDGGDRYLNTIYCNRWRRRNGICDTALTPFGSILSYRTHS